MDKIEEILTRGVDKIYPSREELEKVLLSEKKIKIYIGADPTGPQLHLGHATNFIILSKLQDLGHKIIILIGDFTGMIGDPTDKNTARQPLSKEEVLANSSTYKEQVAKYLKFDGQNPAEIKFNSEWLAKLSSEKIIRLMAKVTAQQMLERDMFQKRLAEKKPISLHEFLYPLLQGYDSVAMNIDAEMGGTDQTFNMLMGRNLVREMLGKEKFVITTKLLVNPRTGKKLMNKSEGNYVAVNDSPEEIFGKIMALPDEVIEPVFKLCTQISLEQVEEIKKELDGGKNPMLAKKTLAHQIVKELHSKESADKAQQDFENTFQKGQTGTVDIPTKPISSLPSNPLSAGTLILQCIEVSISEAKRLLKQRAVELNGNVIEEGKDIKINPGDLIRVGKKRFLRFV